MPSRSTSKGLKMSEIYDLTLTLIKKLSSKEKLKIAIQLIQLVEQEDEFKKPEANVNDTISFDEIKEKISKSQPKKIETLTNFIMAMFNFKGGISKEDAIKIVKKLEKSKYIKVETNKVTYL